MNPSRGLRSTLNKARAVNAVSAAKSCFITADATSEKVSRERRERTPRGG